MQPSPDRNHSSDSRHRFSLWKMQVYVCVYTLNSNIPPTVLVASLAPCTLSTSPASHYVPPSRNCPPFKEQQVALVERCEAGMHGRLPLIPENLLLFKAQLKGWRVEGWLRLGSVSATFVCWFWVAHPDGNTIITKPITYFKIIGCLFTFTKTKGTICRFIIFLFWGG